MLISAEQLVNVQGVVFFDAKCSLCWRVQKQLTAWGNTQALKFVPLQQFEAWKTKFEVLQPVTEAEIRQGIRVFELKANRLLIGVPAVAFCLKNCRFPYHWLGTMLAMPVFQPVLIPLYNWLAANRYRFLPALSEAEEAKLYAAFEAEERCSTTTTGACG